MGKCILRPSYGDMSVVVLGSSVSAIKKAFKKHWSDELEMPEEYSKAHIKKINAFLAKDHKSIEEIDKDYNKNFDEDYSFEET